MKKQLFILLGFFLFSAAITGQNSNLLVFSDEEPFILSVNGVQHNNEPKTNVKATGIGPNLRVRVKFANAALPALEKTFPVEDNTETTLRVKRDKKGEWKLAFFGSVPINETKPNVATPQSQYNTAGTNSSASETNNAGSTNAYNTNAQVNGGNTTVTSSTVTTTSTKGNPDAAAVNINMNGMGVSMNVSGMDMGANSSMNTTTSTTVTTSHSSSGYNSASYNDNNANAQNHSGHNGNHNQNSGYNAGSNSNTNAGCRVAMPAADFSKLKNSVESKPFSDTKMSTAKVATKNTCLSTNQVKEICKLFSMDEDKLEYAKYAYAYCIDKANYYQVSEIFSFSSTTDEFNKFLEQ